MLLTHVIDQIGEFVAFINKAVRVKFFDRTMLQINSTHDRMCVIDNLGEKLIYHLEKVNRQELERVLLYIIY